MKNFKTIQLLAVTISAAAILISASQAFAQQATQDGITITPKAGGIQYLIMAFQAAGGSTPGAEWFEAPVSASYQLNYVGSGNVTLSDATFFLSPTEIPLDNLNFGDLPPSQFTPAPTMDTTLPPNTPYNFSLPDATSTMTLLAIACATQAAFRRRLGKS